MIRSISSPFAIKFRKIGIRVHIDVRARICWVHQVAICLKRHETIYTKELDRRIGVKIKTKTKLVISMCENWEMYFTYLNIESISRQSLIAVINDCMLLPDLNAVTWLTIALMALFTTTWTVLLITVTAFGSVPLTIHTVHTSASYTLSTRWWALNTRFRYSSCLTSLTLM